MLLIYGLFLLVAFIVSTPGEIAAGLSRLITSRSVLISDYVAIGGIGATLVNAALVGLFTMTFLLLGKIRPNGSTIMGLFLSTGFAFFGKNIFNMLPITAGVWLFARVKKHPFRDMSLSAMLSATLCPVVSEFSFIPEVGQPLGAILGVGMGILIGFIFTPVSSSLLRAHSGFCLYNMGFAGGMIGSLIVSVIRGMGMKIETVLYWSSDYQLLFAALLYGLSLLLILCGFLDQAEPGETWRRFKKIHTHTGRLVTDYYHLYGNATYINMGVFCAFTTTLLLVLGGDLNGPTVGSILSITGFGAFGKHLRNATPLLAGAVLATYINQWDPMSPVNTLAILFSTCNAPIAGQFGWLWGIVAGFLHVSLAHWVGNLNGGLNLYNNGFTGGIVALVMVPVILSFYKRKEHSDGV